MRFFPPRGLPAALVLALAATPAAAAILKLIPLKEAVEQQAMIFVVSVEKLDPDKPALYLKFEEKLKGDVPFDKFAVNMTGDAEGKKGGHTKAMFDRLEVGRKLILFTTKRAGAEVYDTWAFTEGTWFSMQGRADADGKTVRWAFLHGEPYLRRTFKGTTEELKKVVADAVAKKADPPGPNKAEPPGFGPVVEKKKCVESGVRSQGSGDRRQETGDSETHGAGSRNSAISCPLTPVSCPLTPVSWPVFGVIPSFAVLGPMALIAALFPGVAAKMAVGMKKWRAFLVVASVNSTLAIAFYFTQKYLPDVKLFSSTGFTMLLMGITAVGLCWAGRRYRRIAQEDPAVTETPGRGEVYALAGLTVLVGLIAASVRFVGPWSATLELPMREFTFIGIALLVATLYAAYRNFTRAADGPTPNVRLSLSGELVGLGVLFLCGLLAVVTPGRANFATNTQAGDADDAVGPRLVSTDTFAVGKADQVMSSVTVAGDYLYFGAAKQSGFRTAGYAFCVNRTTGKVEWAFDADTDLKPVFCTPIVADGRVYFGEGLHTDSGCKLYCLDAKTGKPAWEKPFETGSHTEGTPRVFDGKVLFSAGDDGLFAADAKTGAEVWHFEGAKQKLHIDTPPAVVGNRVFAGSGYDTYATLCLDARTGQELWKQPAPFRVFGAPLALGKHVFYGVGTGNLTQDTEGDEKTPAGAVLCLDAETGNEVWRYDLTRSVHAGLAGDAFSIYAASRDGCVHCLDRKTGKLRWKTGIGGAILAGAAVATSGGMPVAVYAVSREGRVACLNPQTGKVVWEKELPGFTWDGQEANGVFGTPAIVTEPTPTGSRRTIYVGAMTVTANTRKKACAVFRFVDEIGE